METVYREILQLTEETESLLKAGDFERLAPLLVKRQEAFSRLQSGSGAVLPPLEEVSWIKRIRKCEDRCTAFATEKKRELQGEMKTARHGRRLHNAYGGSSSLRG